MPTSLFKPWLSQQPVLGALCGLWWGDQESQHGSLQGSTETAGSGQRAAGRVLARLPGAAWPRVLHRAGAAGGRGRGTGQGSGGAFPGAQGEAQPGLAPGMGWVGATPSPLPARCRQPSCPCRAGAVVMNPARRGEGARQPVYLRFMRAPSCPSRRFQFRLSVFPH